MRTSLMMRRLFLLFICTAVPTLHAQLGSVSLDSDLGAPLALAVPGFLNSSNFNVSLELGQPIVYDFSMALPDAGSADILIELSVTNVYVHDGPPEAPTSAWVDLGPIDFAATNSTSPLFDSAGSLSHTGKTYHLSGSYSGYVEIVLSPLPPVITPLTGVVEVAFFLEYPFMTNPVLNAYMPDSSNGVIVIEFQDGIYSNSVSLPLPDDDEIVRFYRLFSPDGDPTNAIIEFRDSMQAGTWLVP